MGDCLPATDPHHVVMMFCSSSQYSDWNSKWFDIFCHQQNSSCINKTTLDLIHSFSAPWNPNEWRYGCFQPIISRRLCHRIAETIVVLSTTQLIHVLRISSSGCRERKRWVWLAHPNWQDEGSKGKILNCLITYLEIPMYLGRHQHWEPKNVWNYPKTKK